MARLTTLTPASGFRIRLVRSARVRRHVGEARVMTLEADDDGLRRPVAVLGDDDVRLAGARGLLVVDVLAMEQDDHIRVLLD